MADLSSNPLTAQIQALKTRLLQATPKFDIGGGLDFGGGGFLPNPGGGGGTTGYPSGGGLSTTFPVGISIGLGGGSSSSGLGSSLSSGLGALGSLMGIDWLRWILLIVGILCIGGAIYLYKPTQSIITVPINTAKAAAKAATVAATEA